MMGNTKEEVRTKFETVFNNELKKRKYRIDVTEALIIADGIYKLGVIRHID
jgi:hypothetical protein